MSTSEQKATTTPRQAASPGRWILRVLGVLLLLALLLALLGIAGWMAYIQVKKSAPSFHLALQTVQKDPQVMQVLGEPVDDASSLLLPPSGNENVEAERGEASWWFDIQGPKGRARVFAQASRLGGNWSLTMLEVTPEKGPKIKPELDSDKSGPDDAPKWSPPSATPSK
jgi:hypothetical protein